MVLFELTWMGMLGYVIKKEVIEPRQKRREEETGKQEQEPPAEVADEPTTPADPVESKQEPVVKSTYECTPEDDRMSQSVMSLGDTENYPASPCATIAADTASEMADEDLVSTSVSEIADDDLASTSVSEIADDDLLSETMNEKQNDWPVVVQTVDDQKSVSVAEETADEAAESVMSREREDEKEKETPAPVQRQQSASDVETAEEVSDILVKKTPMGPHGEGDDRSEAGSISEAESEVGPEQLAELPLYMRRRMDYKKAHSNLAGDGTVTPDEIPLEELDIQQVNVEPIRTEE